MHARLADAIEVLRDLPREQQERVVAAILEFASQDLQRERALLAE